MRRITKKALIFSFGLLFTIFYSEFLIYYILVIQCQWPMLDTAVEDSQLLKAFILADTHLLGPRKGRWLDKWRREWQMHQAFQSIIILHQPDVVFVLGDLFDEGEWSNDEQFHNYVKGFFQLFSMPNGVKMHAVAGNHDIGFHNSISKRSVEIFSNLLNSPPVQLLSLKGNHFVLINSMAMYGDPCRLCREARSSIENISETLNCSKSPINCNNIDNYFNAHIMNYSRPILMQHFPLYRLSDASCTEPDAPPLPEKNKPFRQNIDTLSRKSTEYLVSKIKPRAAFGGHTHHGCLLRHSFENIEFYEYSVPSFSWRNRPDPKYMLVTITPGEYAINKCALPRETTIVISAVIMISIVSCYTFKMGAIGRVL